MWSHIGILGLGFGDVTPIMEPRLKRSMEHETDVSCFDDLRFRMKRSVLRGQKKHPSK